MKIVLDPYKLQVAEVKSSSFNSGALESIAYYGMAVQVNISSASGLSGTMKLQASNDGSNWIDLCGCCSSDLVNISFSGNTSEMWHYTSILAFKYIRLSVTILSGSATFEALVTGVRL
jgi:hypothetical protein